MGARGLSYLRGATPPLDAPAHPRSPMDSQSIPKSVFRRCVKDEIGADKLITQEALALLQKEAEKFMVTQFNWASEVAGANGRVTLRANDMTAVANADFRTAPGAKTILSYTEDDDADLLNLPSEVVAEEVVCV